MIFAVLMRRQPPAEVSNFECVPFGLASDFDIRISDLVAASPRYDTRDAWFVLRGHCRRLPVGRSRIADHESCVTYHSSMWQNIPSRSFGSNQVLFGGIMPPASAIAIRSSMLVGNIENAHAYSPLLTNR